MAIDVPDALLRALPEHNPWWERGAAGLDLPRREKSDFYHLARPDREGSQFEDVDLLALVGRRGAGKTTLLRQFVAHRIEAGAAPEQFLYLPFDEDPLVQLRSDDQLRAAVRYYESRILGRVEEPGPQFLLFDDVHRIEHREKPTMAGWGEPTVELLDAGEDRHVVVTASAGVQVTRELERVGMAADRYDVQPILPEKFRDYLFGLYPELESGETRVSPTSIRTGAGSLPAAIGAGGVDRLVAELRGKHDQLAHRERTVQSRVLDYLAVGGVLGFAHGGAVTADELTRAAYEDLRDDVREALYQDVPGFESIQTIADVERLCALAARHPGGEPVRFQSLTELFDVDRRTIADSYLPALAELQLLNGVTEYDNSRPRSVALYLRDTGLATALAREDPTTVRTDLEREAELARVAGFDHTMRLAYGVNAAQGLDRTPSVQFWRGEDGLLEYVATIDDVPVPIGVAYRARERAGTIAALREFRADYDAPVGLLVTGESTGDERPVAAVDDGGDGGIVRLPYWLYMVLC